MSIFFIKLSAAPRDLHSFPTRRSSDLRSSSAVADDDHIAARLQAVEGGTDLLDSHRQEREVAIRGFGDRKSTRLNSSHPSISYAVFCLKKKKKHSLSRHAPFGLPCPFS